MSAISAAAPPQPAKKWKRKKTRSRKNRMRRDTRPKDKRPTYFSAGSKDFLGHGWNKELLEEQARAATREAEIQEGLPEERGAEEAWVVDVKGKGGSSGGGSNAAAASAAAAKPPPAKRQRTSDSAATSSAGGTMKWEVKDAKVGDGASAAKVGVTVTVAITGSEGSFRGNRFSSAAALSWVVGDGSVLEALDAGVIGMSVGGKRRITVEPLAAPQPVASADAKRGTAPAGVALCFVVKLRALE